MWLWRLAFAALQALLVFSYHRLRLLQSQLGEPDSQTSSSHVNAHSALERSRESSKTVDLIVKVTGDFSVQLFWTDFEGSEVFYGTVLPGRARPMQLRTFMTHPWRLYHSKTGVLLAHFVYTESATVWQAHSPLAETVQISVGSAPAVPWWNLWAICNDQAMHQHCTIAMELLSALVLGAGQGLMCVLAMAAGGRGGHHLLKLARAVL
eukprot:jgi/Astpho2/7194/fgenesh1_pg.00113_%23_33_t